MSSQSRSILPLLSIVGSFLIVLFALLFRYTKFNLGLAMENTPIPSTNIPIVVNATLTPVGTPLANGWYHYVDQEAGYSFDYPASVLVTTSYERDSLYKMVLIQLEIPYGNDESIFIYVLPNMAHKTEQEFIAERYDIEKISDNTEYQSTTAEMLTEIASKTKPITVNGLSGVQTTFLATNVPSNSKYHLFLPRSDVMYYIGLSAGMMVGNPVLPEAETLFWDVMDTFQFVENK